MGWLLSRFRAVFTVIRGGEVGVQPPQNLRFELGAEASGSFPATVRWDAPASWGNDAAGSGTREYNGEYSRRGTNADGTTYTGSQTTPVPISGAATSFNSVAISAARGSLWDFRIRSTNAEGDHSTYVRLVIHATEQDGFLTLNHRFLRINDGTNYRRLRLVP